jgi:hypothetical protein
MRRQMVIQAFNFFLENMSLLETRTRLEAV